MSQLRQELLFGVPIATCRGILQSLVQFPLRRFEPRALESAGVIVEQPFGLTGRVVAQRELGGVRTIRVVLEPVEPTAVAGRAERLEQAARRTGLEVIRRERGGESVRPSGVAERQPQQPAL